MFKVPIFFIFMKKYFYWEYQKPIIIIFLKIWIFQALTFSDAIFGAKIHILYTLLNSSTFSLKFVQYVEFKCLSPYSYFVNLDFIVKLNFLIIFIGLTKIKPNVFFLEHILKLSNALFISNWLKLPIFVSSFGIQRKE